MTWAGALSAKTVALGIFARWSLIHRPGNRYYGFSASGFGGMNFGYVSRRYFLPELWLAL